MNFLGKFYVGDNKVKEGDIYYNTETQQYYLAIGAKRDNEEILLYFYNALCKLEHNERYFLFNIVMVCLINNKNYRKSIQTQDLTHISVDRLIYSEHLVYDRHINISQYKIDILKCKMLDKGFETIQDLYVEQQTKAINYISSCIKFLEQFQMYQNIVLNDNKLKEPAIYLGTYNGTILYYSNYCHMITNMDFEMFKVEVTPDTGVDKIDITAFLRKYHYGQDINYIKKLVQKEKKILKVE